jgi:hypothetical protein
VSRGQPDRRPTASRLAATLLIGAGAVSYAALFDVDLGFDELARSEQHQPVAAH